MSGSNCLLKVAISYVEEVRSPLTDEQLKIAKDTFESLITSRITPETAKERIHTVFGSKDPVDRVVRIMDIAKMEPVPLPEEPEVFSDRENRKRKRARIWKYDEDMRLLAAIYKYGLDNWINISQFVGAGRSRSQCAQRWHRSINPDISKKNWSVEEDKMLFKLVEEFGTTLWSRISSELPGRCDVQCRYRYYQLVKTPPEEKNIILPAEIKFDFAASETLEKLFYSDKIIFQMLVEENF